MNETNLPQPKANSSNNPNDKKDKNDKGDILKITVRDQYRTVEELFEHAQANSSYFTLLGISTFIVTGGLLLDNSAIVIGGMLVAPILTPLLVIGLGLAVGEINILTQVIKLVVKSIVLIILASFVMTILLGYPNEITIFENTTRTAILYFFVAIGSGVAGAFAWARKEISEVLPGVSIAVTIVPPLSLIGIWMAKGNFEIMRFYVVVLILNLIGIVIGSLIVFSLLKFFRVDRAVKAQAEQLESKQTQP